jgi:hypothetical protein
MQLDRFRVDTALEVVSVEAYRQAWVDQLARRFPGAIPLSDPAARAIVTVGKYRVLHKHASPTALGAFRLDRYPVCDVFDEPTLRRRLTFRSTYRSPQSFDQIDARARRAVDGDEEFLRRHVAATVFDIVLDSVHDPNYWDLREGRWAGERCFHTFITYLPPLRPTYIIRVMDDRIDLVPQETYYCEYLYMSEGQPGRYTFGARWHNDCTRFMSDVTPIYLADRTLLAIIDRLPGLDQYCFVRPTARGSADLILPFYGRTGALIDADWDYEICLLQPMFGFDQLYPTIYIIRACETDALVAVRLCDPTAPEVFGVLWRTLPTLDAVERMVDWLQCYAPFDPVLYRVDGDV